MYNEHDHTAEPSVANITLNHEFATMSLNELLNAAITRASIKIATIVCGSKRINLKLDDDESFSTFIETTDKPKTLEDTTTSYMAVKKIIQGYANRLGRAFTYRLVTQNSNLKKWARTKGREIFTWSNEYEDGFLEYEIFEVTIKPQKRNA